MHVSNSLSLNTFPCLTTFPDSRPTTSKKRGHGKRGADNFCRLHVAIAVKTNQNDGLFHNPTDGLKNSIHGGN